MIKDNFMYYIYFNIYIFYYSNNLFIPNYVLGSVFIKTIYDIKEAIRNNNRNTPSLCLVVHPQIVEKVLRHSGT